MGKLTTKQREFLRDAAKPDGRVAYDGHDERTGRSLAKRGLVWLPDIFGFSTHPATAAFATALGRSLLSSEPKSP